MGGSLKRTGLRVKRDIEARRMAAELFEQGHGHRSTAKALRIPRQTVKQWRQIYRALGSEAPPTMDGEQARHTHERKVAAASAVVDGGMSKRTPWRRSGSCPWRRSRDGARSTAGALRPKPKGRPKGSVSRSRERTREQELEERCRRLEAEVAYLKIARPGRAGRALTRAKVEAVSALRAEGCELGRLLACPEPARSTYCYALGHPAGPAGPELRGAVAEIFSSAANGCGHRRVAMCLRAEPGATIADKTALKMMLEMGIRCGIRREADRHRHNSYRGVVGETFGDAIGATSPWAGRG